MNSRPANLARGVAFILVLLMPLIAPQSVSASAKRLFEQAYAAEKTDPERAIELYRIALERRLDPKLRSAAYWRLFFLYKRMGQFGQALRISDRLGSPKRMEDVLGNLLTDVQQRFAVSAASATHYVAGLRALYRLRGAPPGDRPGNFLTSFRQAVEAGSASANLRTAISNALVEQGFGEYAGSFSGGAPVSETERRLAHAARLLSAERTDEAEAVLMYLARSGDLDNAEKGRVLYLLARLERKRGRAEHATAFFRLAARYAPGDLSERNTALAAYVLYRKGYSLQAHALLRGTSASRDANVRLLHLILRWEVEKDQSAFTELARMREKLRGKPPAGISAFLAARAVRIAEGGKSP